MVLAIATQMTVLAVRAGNLPALVVVILVFPAVAWFLTRPAAQVPPPL